MCPRFLARCQEQSPEWAVWPLNDDDFFSHGVVQIAVRSPEAFTEVNAPSVAVERTTCNFYNGLS